MIKGYVSSDEDDYDDYDDYDFGYSDPLIVEKDSFSLPEIQSKEVKEKLLSALEESEKIQRFFKAINDLDLLTLENLISLGVSPDCTDEQEWTALMKACGMGNFVVVQFLLEHGANPNKHRELLTPLMTCCTHTLVGEDSKLSCVRFLLEYGANINAKDKYRTTALMYACDSNYYDIVTELLEVPGIDVNIQDKEGWTALFHAVNQNNIKLVKKLMPYVADLNLQDKCNRTVINLALGKDFKEVAEALGYVEETLPEQEKKIELRDRFLNELPDSKGQGGFANDAEEILHAFNQFNVKNISLPDLLNATEKELYEIGVKFQFDRLSILCKGIHRYHLRPWKSSSVHDIIPEVQLSLENIIAITGTFAKHLTIANASLKYLDTRISSRQNKGEMSVEKEAISLLINTYNSAEKLRILLKEIIKRIEELKKLLLNDHQSLRILMAETLDKINLTKKNSKFFNNIKPEIPADYIYPLEKVKFRRKFLNFFLYGIGAVITGFFISYNKPNSYFKKLVKFCFNPVASFFLTFQSEPFQDFFDKNYKAFEY